MAIRTLSWQPVASKSSVTLTGYEILNGATVIKTVAVVASTTYDFANGTYNLGVRGVYSDNSKGTLSNVVVETVATATNKALEFLVTQTDRVDLDQWTMDSSNNWFIERRFKVVTHNNNALAALCGCTGSVQQWGRTANTTTGAIYVAFSNKTITVSTGSFALDTWVTLRMEWNSSTNSLVIKLNGSIIDTLTGVTPQNGTYTYHSGKFTPSGGSVQGTFIIDYENYNDEVIVDYNTITAGNVSDNNGHNYPVITDRADVNAMLINV